MGRYWRPAGLADALHILSEAAPVILAGGTWLARQGGAGAAGEDLLDISAIEALHGIALRSGEWRIGAATTWSALLATPLPPLFAGLKQAAATLGAPQIRNQGTIGGNLAARFPAADGVPALLCLDASVELARGATTRRLPLAEFLAGAAQGRDELLTAILLPSPPQAVRCGFAKHGYRRAMTMAVVTAAACLDIAGGLVAGARIALGACTPLAQRLAVLEAALIGQPASPGLAALVTPDMLAGMAMAEDFRAPAGYRQAVALVLLRRLLTALGTGDEA